METRMILEPLNKRIMIVHGGVVIGYVQKRLGTAMYWGYVFDMGRKYTSGGYQGVMNAVQSVIDLSIAWGR